jgi:effector-binding domain-containing protein
MLLRRGDNDTRPDENGALCIAEGETMNLTEEPEIVEWPGTHYMFIEKIGPFMINAPQSWQELHAAVPAIAAQNQITGYFSLYKMGPDVYRAGVSVTARPVALPEGVQYEKFVGGKYSRFVLTGSYSQLPEASGRVWQVADEKRIPLRDGFAVENYVNDPRTTPEEQLITQILIPTA